jgi:thiamine biosynthesis lipoprotein
MGTDWWIICDAPRLLPAAEAQVRRLEACLSRFRAGSALTRLNLAREVRDATLAAVTRAALALQVETGGAFDPTLGARLASLGYDRPFAAIGRPAPAGPAPRGEPLRVTVRDDRVRLEGPGALDLGGIAKGWTVDRVLERLRHGGARSALVDGGGDIGAFGGPWRLGAGDGLVVEVGDGALATSSALVRRWRDADGVPLHHVLDPRTSAPARAEIDTATVSAPDAATADGLATALLVDPARVVALLPALGARAALRGHDGRWWTTADWSDAA